MRPHALVLATLALAAAPPRASAQAYDPSASSGVMLVPVVPTVPTYSGVALSDQERERLLARTASELESDPIPTDITLLSLELGLVEEQRNGIDIGGITALQWIGAVVMIGGGVVTVLGVLVGGLVAIFGGDAVLMVYGAAIGLPLVALGGLFLGLAELDGNLHRRRELDSRIRRLRDAQRSGLVPYASSTGAGLGWRVAF